MKKIIFLGIVFIGLISGIRWALSSGQLLTWIDENPEAGWVPSVGYWVGTTYALANLPEKAAIYFEHTLANIPSDHALAYKLHFRLANAYDDIGRRKEAFREFETVVYDYPENKFTEICINRLKMGDVSGYKTHW